MLAVAHRFCRDREDALDVMQEAFLYLLRQFPGFELRAKLTTYLYPVVRNLATDRARRRQRWLASQQRLRERGGAGGGGGGGQQPSPPPPREDDDLHRLLACLPQTHREVVLLRFVDDLPLAEIAQAMGLPVGTVKSRLHHALRMLRQDPRVREFFD